MAYKIALAGNPNCGKTTLFNNLTGSSQYVGNWPGVTVEKKEGKLRGNKNVIIQDLPGIYSLSPYTLEEVITRKYLVNETPDAILNIIDGTNIERNLYLTTQLIELGLPTVVAVNMIDIVRKTGDKINLKKLSDRLGCTVVELSALKGEGCLEAAKAAIMAADEKIETKQPDMFTGDVKKAIDGIEEMISEQVGKSFLRWYAVKIFERDEEILKELELPESTLAKIEELVSGCEKNLDDDADSIITNQRYSYITEIVGGVSKKKLIKGSLTFSDKVDQIVTNRILALPIFAAIMFVVYYISVTSIGTIVTDFTNDTLFGEWIQPAVAQGLKSIGSAPWVISLVVDGIIGGLSAPIGFAPQMAVLFLFLSILEDCGYMARVAFIMDRAFRKFGLSGKSFIPFLISSGCGVPGIMATRTIENEKDRRMTMITTTMIPCGAKLPVIALIAGAVMGGAWWMAPLMYFTGIIAVIMSCVMLKKFRMFAGEAAPFVMELPQYHIPAAKGVLMHVWERVWSFLKKAGTVLFLCCVVMWFLSSFGFANGSFGLVESQDSMLAAIGGAIAPIFAPLGFGQWQPVASALSGFAAKEGIVTTMGVLAGVGDVGEADTGLWEAVMRWFPSGAAAMSFLIFNLLNSPCLAAISTMSKEMANRKWVWFALIYQNVFAYVAALMVYQFGGLVTGVLTFGVGSTIAICILIAVIYLLFRKSENKGGGTWQISSY